MFEPVKVGFGQFMGRFFATLRPTTQQMQEYVQREAKKAIMWAPGRMVDAAEDMLGSYLKADVEHEQVQKPYRMSRLPVVIVAMAKDHSASGRDYTRQVADPEWIIMPDDPLKRLFKVQTVAADLRIQVAVFAHDEPSARSIAAQFQLFLDRTENRAFTSPVTFAGVLSQWPAQFETPEAPAVSIQTEAKNLTILVMDLTIKATIPLFEAAPDAGPNDGTQSPFGFPVVVAENITSYSGRDVDPIGKYRIEA